MPESLQVQIEKLNASIAGLEAQRSALGDAIVEPALIALRQQLTLLEEQFNPQVASVEERRFVSILFIDIVGSTNLAEKLDPEEWRQVVQQVHTTLGKVVSAHHGIVAQYLGDGLLAFFGSHEASEHDPENAIRAALDGMAGVANLQGPVKVQLRAGIHSGLVVVGELGDALHREFTASGDAMNLAARLQSAAPPGGVLISQDAYHYVRGMFEVTPRPPLTVKGKSETLQTYLVRRARPRPFQSLARGVAKIKTRTVGRELETHTLQMAYLEAYERRCLVWAQLSGDLGVGKSRLLEDLKGWLNLRPESFHLLQARAFPDDAHQPFALVRRLWFERFQIAEDAPLEQVEKKWVERFKEFFGQEDNQDAGKTSSEEAAHALGLLVGLPFHNSPYIKAMRSDPNQVKGRSLVVSRQLIKAFRHQFPLVVLLEDLQWADAASCEYLVEAFLEEVEDKQPEGLTNGLFILGAARPEWHPPKELSALFKSSPQNKGNEDIKTMGMQIVLGPITDQAIRELVKDLFQRVEAVPEQIIDQLIERSEGVPYFTEELFNWFIDHDILDTHNEPWRFSPKKLKEQPLPATLQHLLLTRLNSLSQTERAALQRGAIFGRRFWTRGVEALGIADAGDLLEHLQPSGFVEALSESTFQGDTEWSFHQNLLQEVIYESVLKKERAALHKMAANWLERQARQTRRLDEFAGLLGEHYERAGELSMASEWYLQAGRRAMSQGAPREARKFYTQALELLPPVDREMRWQASVDLIEALSVLDEVEPLKTEISALLEMARSFDDPNYLAEAYYRQAILGWQLGNGHLLEQAAREALTMAQRCGNEAIEIKALSYIGMVGVLHGDKALIIQSTEEALRRARHLGDESVLALVLVGAAHCYAYLGDIARYASLQLEQIQLDHRLGNRKMEAIGLNNMGVGYITIGLYKQARSLIEQARAIFEALGTRRLLAYTLAHLGIICLVTGDLRMSRQFEEQALKEISASQDDRGKVGILVFLGRVLLVMEDTPVAARRFIEAQELARNINLDAQACEATAGLAASAILQGQLGEARQYACEAWDYLKEHGRVGMNNPIVVYRICAETFDALGETENLQAVLDIGYQAIMEEADKISSPEWRKSFLENNPDARAFLEMWERRKQQ